MRRFARSTLLLALLVSGLAPVAHGQEAFPGQNELAAGLTCHRNLDLVCARTRLEKALATFSPEGDPDFLEHVRTARWVLTLCHVARDDLGLAEKELHTLLLLDPSFHLPAGDHPPKIRYVFEQAKEKIETSRKPDPVEDDPKPDPKPDPVPDPKDDPAAVVPKTDPPLPYRFSAHAYLVGLFGEDADKVSSGPGAGLRFGWQASGSLSIDLGFNYAYHPTADKNAPLQSMALFMAGRFSVPAGPLAVRLGGGMGVLAMGVADRYDNWGFNMAASASLVWPPQGSWGLSLELNPSVLITAGGSSFYLPVGLAGEVRW